MRMHLAAIARRNTDRPSRVGGDLDISLVVQCADGRYYGSVRVPTREAYPWVLDFLRRNKGPRLRDVVAKEMDFPAETVH